MSQDEKTPEVVKTRACHLCGIEMNHGQVHISLQHCVKDLKDRVTFLRGVTLGQAKELDWERTAISATHRIAYILLEHFAPGDINVTLPRTKFETVDQGAGVTMTELENGDFKVVGVLPAKKEEVGS